MSDLSYLETLSNKELHAKCLEYDLPNIPVTDTSRKVILRRLHATILGQPRKNAVTAAKKTPRRETIHSSKSRPTTAVTTNVSLIQESPSTSNNNNNRRSVAATPRKRYSANISPIRSAETTTTVSDVGSQSEGDDDCYTIESPQSQKQQTLNDSRSRRSVSLSKSGVLTTSYTRELQSAYQETEEEPQSYTYKRPETVQPTSSHTQRIYEPRIEPSHRPKLYRQNLTHTQLNSTSYNEAANNYVEPPIQQSLRDSFSGSRAAFAVTAHQETEEEPQSYTYKRPETVQSASSHTQRIYEPRIEPSYHPELYRQNLTHTQLNSTSSNEAANRNAEPPIQQSSRNTFSGSRASFAMTGSDTSPTRTFGESGFARGRLLQPVYNAKPLYPQLNEFYDQQKNRPEPMEVDSDTETEPEPENSLHQRQYRHKLNDNRNSPYVSRFSTQMDSRQRSSPLSRPQMRSTIRQPNPKTPVENFRAMLISLDRQYNLKFYFFLLLAVTIATFIYVILTPAV